MREAIDGFTADAGIGRCHHAGGDSDSSLIALLLNQKAAEGALRNI